MEIWPYNISALGTSGSRCVLQFQAAEMCAEVPVEAGHADVVALVASLEQSMSKCIWGFP